MQWRSFPLEQVNAEDEEWLFWEQPVDEARSLRAFLAAEAARDQGEPVFRAFVDRLLTAVHERKMPVHAVDTIRDVARETPGLDVDRLMQEMEAPELRQRISRDYQRAVDEEGVFGTPTFLFPDGDAVFVKMTPAPPDDALSLFESVRDLSQSRPYIRELKKPRRPER